MYKYLMLLSIIILSCNTPAKVIEAPVDTTEKVHAKNIILLIGDGMSLSQVTAALYSNDNKLNLEKFKYIGFHKPYSYDNLITDSAAGATAFSIGKKSYNGAIGVDHDTISHQSILEEAEANGLATGLVATSSLTHATPAAFYAHQPSRKMDKEIASDFLNTEIDIAIGGGKKYFDSERNDKSNLILALRDKEYMVKDFNMAPLSSIYIPKSTNFVYFTDEGSPIKERDGRDWLPMATRKAISHLDKKNDDGFFLMLESSQIDWGGHDNDQDYIITEMLEFDKIIKIAYDFAKKDGETLVIITGDHETGGMSVNYGSTMNNLKCAFTSEGHTADLIPVYSFGPGAEEFMGIYENTDIYHKMRKVFGF